MTKLTFGDLESEVLEEIAGAVEDKGAHVARVEAVNVLVGGDGLDDRLFVYLGRQGKLDENAVEFRVPVQFLDTGKDLLFRGVRRQFLDERVDARGGAGFRFLFHVDAGGRIGADYDDGEAGFATVPGGKAGGLGCDSFAQAF